MKTLLLAVIRLYQLSFSAVFGRTCRYLPSCSEYMSEAIVRHGVGRGVLMGTARICRCHPWGGHGFDPVPQIYAGPVWRMPQEPEKTEGGPEAAPPHGDAKDQNL